MQSEELAHHGIPGMRWGVRRFQNKDGSLTAAGKKRYGIDGGEADSSGSGDKAQGKKSRPKKISEMSDAELRQRLNRLQMEKQLKQLMSEQEAEKQKKGESFVKKTAKNFIQTAISGRVEKWAQSLGEGKKKNEPQNKPEEKTTKIDPKKNPGEYSDKDLSNILSRAQQENRYQKVVREEWASNRQKNQSAADREKEFWEKETEKYGGHYRWTNSDRKEHSKNRKQYEKEYGTIKD